MPPHDANHVPDEQQDAQAEAVAADQQHPGRGREDVPSPEDPETDGQQRELDASHPIVVEVVDHRNGFVPEAIAVPVKPHDERHHVVDGSENGERHDADEKQVRGPGTPEPGEIVDRVAQPSRNREQDPPEQREGDEAVPPEHRVRLDPGERRRVRLAGTIPGRPPGSYEQGVFLDGSRRGLTTDLRVDLDPAEDFFRITDLDAPAKVEQGDDVTVVATVTNTDSRTRGATVEYRIGPRVLDDASVRLRAGRSETVTFRVRIPDLADGTYEYRWFDPEDGGWTDGGSLEGGDSTDLGSPPFGGDAAVLLERS